MKKQSNCNTYYYGLPGEPGAPGSNGLKGESGSLPIQTSTMYVESNLTLLIPVGYSVATITCVGGGGAGGSGFSRVISVNTGVTTAASGSGGGSGQSVSRTISVEVGGSLEIQVGKAGKVDQEIVGDIGGNGGETIAIYKSPASLAIPNQFINASGGYGGSHREPGIELPRSTSSGSYGGGGSELMIFNPSSFPQGIQLGVLGGIGSEGSNGLQSLGDDATLSVSSNSALTPNPLKAGSGGNGGNSNAGKTAGLGGPDIMRIDSSTYSFGGGGGGGAPGPLLPSDLEKQYGSGSYYIEVIDQYQYPIAALAGIFGSGGGGGAVILINFGVGNGSYAETSSGADGSDGYALIVLSSR
jgi:hypothetical protein